MERYLDYRISFALAKGYGSFCEINVFPLQIRQIRKPSSGKESCENCPLPVFFGGIDEPARSDSEKMFLFQLVDRCGSI